jgi:uncharacterized protein
MSEEQNVRTVQEAYAAFKRGEIQGVLDTLTENIEWHTPGEGLFPQGGTHRGKESVGRFFQTIDATIVFGIFEPQTFVAQGDNVVAVGRYDGTVKATGQHFQSDFVMTFKFDGEKIVRYQEYMDTAALAQAYQAKAA